MSTEFNMSLVRFAEADWKLLISYFVIIVSLSMIVYFAIFVDEKSNHVEVSEEHNSVHHLPEEVAEESAPVAATTPKKRRSLGAEPVSEKKVKTPKTSEKKRAESPNPVKVESARSETPKRTTSTPKKRATTPKRKEVAAPTSDNEDANSGNKTAKVSKRRTSAAASEAFADLASPASRRMSLRTRR